MIMLRRMSFFACIVVAGLSASLAYATVLPPSDGRVLWMAADTSVTTDGSGTVTAWKDAGTSAEWVDYVRGIPKKTTAEFPAGTRSVIRFLGTNRGIYGSMEGDGLDLLNDASLRLNPISIYTVASIDAGTICAVFLATYGENGPPTGFGFGISDDTAERVKWMSGYPVDEFQPAIGQLTPEKNYRLTATVDGSGNKLLGVSDGTTSQDATTTGVSLTYAASSTATLGYLYHPEGGPMQYLSGDIAEVLVYSSVSSAQRTAVESYLQEKYFAPEPSTLVLLGIGAASLLCYAWRKRK